MARKPDTRKGDRSADGVSVRSFKIADELWAKVLEQAAAEGVPASEIVRQAVIAYLGLDPSTPGVVGRRDR
jgi:hypothetical protein